MSSSRTRNDALYGSTVVQDSTSKSGIVATVGLLSMSGGGSCSGTVVGRTRVLTAAHCVCQITAPANKGNVIPKNAVTVTFPQAPGLQFTSIDVAMHPTSEFACSHGVEPLGGSDLAVVTLGTPVPASVVDDVARVYLGPIESAYYSNKFVWGTQIGFGKTTSYDDDDGDTDGSGIRRFGQVKHLWPNLDSCGVVELDKCNDVLEWHSHVDWSVQSVHAPGDSGGPLFVKHESLGDVVAGVSSGWRGDGTFLAANPKVVQLWAPTGDIGSANNHGFLKPLLGGDSDGDGVPDMADNCPGIKNANQSDIDNDDVGDVCDNCPPQLCVGLPLGFTCVNPKQADKDNDGVGDTCDTCPEHFSGLGGQTKDQDGDHVGDYCDECPGVSDDLAACLGSSTCGAGFCISDAPTGMPAFGRCSLPPNSDGDAFPDACDICPGFKNVSDGNANPEAELRESVEPRADECDPVPIVRLAKQKPETVGQMVVGDGFGPEDVARIRADLWLGKQAAGDGAFKTSQSVGYRHCSCIGPSGKLLTLDECVGGGGAPCSWNDPAGPASAGWRTPTMTTAAGAPILSAGFTAPATFSRNTALDFERFWAWRQDLAAGKVGGDGNCGSGPLSCSTHGALFTTTSGPVVSPRDAADDLRDTFQLIKTPAFELKPPIVIGGTGDPECPSLPCLSWVDPDLYLKDPALTDFAAAFVQPVLAQPLGATVVARTQPSAGVDISAQLSPAVRGLIGNFSVSWLTPAEPSERVRRRGGGAIQAVAFPKDLSDPSVDLIVRSAEGLAIGGRAGPGADLATAAGTPPPIRARVGHGAVFSGVEAAVYVVGGVDAESGAPAQAILRYDVRDQAWASVAPHARERPASRVLSVAWDERLQRVYVLDLDDDRLGPKLERARLLSIDTQSGESRVHWRLPFVGVHDRLWVQWADEGLLLYAGTQKVLRVWRFKVVGDSLSLSGRWTRNGRLLGEPTMGERHPVVAVGMHGAVEYLTVLPTLFSACGPVGSL